MQLIDFSLIVYYIYVLIIFYQKIV